MSTRKRYWWEGLEPSRTKHNEKENEHEIMDGGTHSAGSGQAEKKEKNAGKEIATLCSQ